MDWSEAEPIETFDFYVPTALAMLQLLQGCPAHLRVETLLVVLRATVEPGRLEAAEPR